MLNNNDNEKQHEQDKTENPKQANTIRKASVQAQQKRQKSQTQSQQDDSDSDELSISNPECEGEKPVEDTVLTDLDKRKAMLNKGTKVVKLSKHGPIKEVAYQVINGNRIIHYSRSVVKFDDLRKGQEVTRAYRELINEIGLQGKKKSDQVGHILPIVFGGGLEYNVFPQNPATNVEYCHAHFARLAVEFLEQNRVRNAHIEYQVRLIYNPGETRPYGFYVLVRAYIDDELVPDINGREYIFDWLSNPHPDDSNY